MGKILLCLLLIAVTSFLGYRSGEKYAYRTGVFETLYDFTATFVSRIGVVNDSVSDALKKMCEKLPSVIGDYKDFLGGDTFICKDKKLTNEQKNIVEALVNALGVSDSFNQKQLLNSILETVKIEREKAKNEYQKFTKLSVRLGFSLGLVLVIIIV